MKKRIIKITVTALCALVLMTSCIDRINVTEYYSVCRESFHTLTGLYFPNSKDMGIDVNAPDYASRLAAAGNIGAETTEFSFTFDVGVTYGKADKILKYINENFGVAGFEDTSEPHVDRWSWEGSPRGWDCVLIYNDTVPSLTITLTEIPE